VIGRKTKQEEQKEKTKDLNGKESCWGKRRKVSRKERPINERWKNDACSDKLHRWDRNSEKKNTEEQENCPKSKVKAFKKKKIPCLRLSRTLLHNMEDNYQVDENWKIWEECVKI